MSNRTEPSAILRRRVKASFMFVSPSHRVRELVLAHVAVAVEKDTIGGGAKRPVKRVEIIREPNLPARHIAPSPAKLIECLVRRAAGRLGIFVTEAFGFEI